MTKKTIIQIGPSGPVKFPIIASFTGENRPPLADRPDNASVFQGDNSFFTPHMRPYLRPHQGSFVPVFSQRIVATLRRSLAFGLARILKKGTEGVSSAASLG